MSDTEITFTGTYTCTNHNDRQRVECPVCLVASLTTERDQLRSEFEKLAITTAQAQDRNVSHRLERDKAEAERTDAIYQRACEVERDLRAQLHALQLVCGTNDANKFETWIDRANARAERAEAELATEREKAERYRLTTLKLDAELAKEREKVRVLREALENLRDEQNGAPLCAREEQWKQAMDKADAALATTEDAK
jgi:hypothetical protein